VHSPSEAFLKNRQATLSKGVCTSFSFIGVRGVLLVPFCRRASSAVAGSENRVFIANLWLF
jgi:hypothetical protein